MHACAWLKQKQAHPIQQQGNPQKFEEMSKRKAAEACPEKMAETRMKADLSTYFKRATTGFYKKITPEDKKTLEDGQHKYQNMTASDQLEFAKCFQANKKSKGFGWVREFTDSLTIKKKTSEGGLQKYMTRSFATYRGSLMPWSMGASPMRALSCIRQWGLPPIGLWWASPSMVALILHDFHALQD